MTRMSADVSWFRDLSAENRSWIGVIVQAGIKSFVDWYGETARPDSPPPAVEVFDAAPRALTGVITLQQTVDLVRVGLDVVAESVDELIGEQDRAQVHQAVLRYGREVAFATAEVYARAAELRGAWDARLEALVVDTVLRDEADEAVLSRASALGWGGRGDVAVAVGSTPDRRAESDLFEEVRRAARAAGMDALCATQGERLVVVLGDVGEPVAAAATVCHVFGEGPVIVGPTANDLAHAGASARAALAGLRAVSGWPEAPRPVASDDLLPERALSGDGHARRHLAEDVFGPLARSRGTLVETLSAYLGHGSSIEGTARRLIVHGNTVRYRLRQVEEITGLRPTDPRDAFTLRVALVLGRQYR